MNKVAKQRGKEVRLMHICPICEKGFNHKGHLNRHIEEVHGRTRIVVYSDIHAPFHDERVVELVNTFCKWYKPEVVVIDGDLVDFHAISKFDKSPERSTGDALRDEVSVANQILKSIRQANPQARIILVVGNHEFRLRKFLYQVAQRTPLLADLLGLMNVKIGEVLPFLLHLQLNKIELVDLDPEIARFTDCFVQFGRLFIGHWDKVHKYGGYTAKNLLADRGVNLVQAHTHRVGSHFRTTLAGVIEAHEIGCLCRLHPHYTSQQDWCHGFAVIEGDAEMQNFTVLVVPIKDYQFRFHKRTFQA